MKHLATTGIGGHIAPRKRPVNQHTANRIVVAVGPMEKSRGFGIDDICPVPEIVHTIRIHRAEAASDRCPESGWRYRQEGGTSVVSTVPRMCRCEDLPTPAGTSLEHGLREILQRYRTIERW